MLLGGLAYLVMFALNFAVAPVLMAGLGRKSTTLCCWPCRSPSIYLSPSFPPPAAAAVLRGAWP